MSTPQTIPSRGLATLLATALVLCVAAPAQAARSPYENMTPIVVRPPKAKTSDELPKNVPGPGPVPAEVPEPATLLTGAVGSGLGLLAWLRHRRRYQPAA